ncbi:hypothetical protein L209DRAFT_754486 [Thermothelomyces heterothallicus CBS 203.75]
MCSNDRCSSFQNIFLCVLLGNQEFAADTRPGEIEPSIRLSPPHPAGHGTPTLRCSPSPARFPRSRRAVGASDNGRLAVRTQDFVYFLRRVMYVCVCTLHSYIYYTALHHQLLASVERTGVAYFRRPVAILGYLIFCASPMPFGSATR